MREMVIYGGPSYVAYHRLKISSVTDDLVEMFGRVLQFDRDSVTFQGMRCLVRAWRDESYTQYHSAKKPTTNQFLLDFDVSYRLRRIRFVLNKVDDLIRLEKAALETLRFRKQDGWLQGDDASVEAATTAFREELTAIKEP